MKKILFTLLSIAIIFTGVSVLSLETQSAHAASFTAITNAAFYSGEINSVIQNQKYNGTIPYVTIRFDDTDLTQIQALKNITNFNLPGIWFLSPGFLDKPGRPTLQQVTDLYNSGIEIGSHTETHYVLFKNTTQVTLQYQIVQSKTDLQNNGFKIFGFAFPNNVITSNSSSLVNRNYNYTTVPFSQNNTVFSIDNDGKPFSLTIPVLHGDGVNMLPPTLDNFDQVKAQVDSAIANKTWVVLLFHRIDDTGHPTHTSPHLFWQILQYVDEQSKLGKIKVVSPAQGLGMMGMINTATTLSPKSVNASNETSFRVNVTDTGIGNKTTPTGIVLWSDGGAGGKFSPSLSCTLEQLQTLGTCSISYTLPKIIDQIQLRGSPSWDNFHRPIQISVGAMYLGDDIHRPSTVTTIMNVSK